MQKMFKKKDLKIEFMSKDKAFWKSKKELSETLVSQMEADIKEIPKLIDFHKEVVKLCEIKMRQFKN